MNNSLQLVYARPSYIGVQRSWFEAGQLSVYAIRETDFDSPLIEKTKSCTQSTREDYGKAGRDDRKDLIIQMAPSIRCKCWNLKVKRTCWRIHMSSIASTFFVRGWWQRQRREGKDPKRCGGSHKSRQIKTKVGLFGLFRGSYLLFFLRLSRFCNKAWILYCPSNHGKNDNDMRWVEYLIWVKDGVMSK